MTSPQQWPKALLGLCLILQDDVTVRRAFYAAVVSPGLYTLGSVDASILFNHYLGKSGQPMYLGSELTSLTEQAVTEPTTHWARTVYLPKAAVATRNLNVSESKHLPEMRWTAFLSNDKDAGGINVNKHLWIAIGGFQLFVIHTGEVERKSDIEYKITLEKHFSMDKNYNFAPNEPGTENNPAGFNLPGLGPLYFPDEWAEEFEIQGDAKRFLVSGAWKRTEEIRIFDSNCDGNWADAYLHSWAIVQHLRPSNPYVSTTKSYETRNYHWISGDLWIFGTQYPSSTKLIPTN